MVTQPCAYRRGIAVVHACKAVRTCEFRQCRCADARTQVQTLTPSQLQPRAVSCCPLADLRVHARSCS
eukprot:6206470-Pleurochrysis_carterae.AAC.4